jgi:hypothetical protein
MSLFEQDEDIQTERRMKAALIAGEITFKAIKTIFFKRMRKQKMLRCVYCERRLRIYKSQYGKLPKDMATLEHLTPLKYNGLKYTEINFACSCSECNGKRGVEPVFKVSETKYIW